MTEAWIKMRANLRRNPKVLALAEFVSGALGVRTLAHRVRTAMVVGLLHETWQLADTHSEDGSLAGYTTAALDEEVGCPGWSEALRKVGWLEVSEAGIALPGFLEHNGQSAKRRDAAAKRMRSTRPSRASGAQEVRTDANPGCADPRTPSYSLSLSTSSSVLPEGESEREAPPSLTARVIERELERVPDGVREALEAWVQHRREIGKGLGASAIRAALTEARKDPVVFGRRVRASILSGTTVLLEDREAQRKLGDLTPKQRDQLRAHESAERLEAFLEQTLADAQAETTARREVMR